MSNFDPNKPIGDMSNRVGLVNSSPTISDYTDDSLNTQEDIQTNKNTITPEEIFNFAQQNSAIANPRRFSTTIDKEKFEKYGVDINEINNDLTKLEEQRVKNQSNLAKLGNAVAQALVNETILGSAVAVSDLFDLIGSSIFRLDNSNYSSELSEYLESLQEKFKNDVAPIYSDPTKTIFNGGLADLGWWASNAPSIMSSLTLMLPSTYLTKGVSYLGKGLKISKRVNDIAKSRAISKVNKLEKLAEKEVSNLKKNAIHDIPFNDYKATYELAQADGIDMIHASNKKWAKSISESRAKKIVDGEVFWKPTDVALAQDRFETGLSAAISRTMENYQEARSVYSDVYNTSIDELSKMSEEDREKFYKNNPEYVGLDDNQIAKDIASKSSDRTFYLDYINTVFDVIQFHGLKNMYKNLGNARETSNYLKTINKEAAKELNKNIALDAANNVEKGLTKTQKFINKSKKAGIKFWDVVKEERGESIEEAINYIAQEEGTHVGNVILSKDVDNSFDTRLQSYLTNGQLWDSAFWGILGGVGFHYIGSGFNRLSDKILNKTSLSEDKIREKEINDRIIRYNNFVNDLKLISNDENPLSRNEDGSYQKFNGDELQKDIVRRQLEANYVYDMAINAMNAGNTNLLISYLEDENVKKAFVDAGISKQNEIDSHVNDIVKQLKEVQDSYLTYVSLMDDMGIQADAAREIATNNTRTDLAIKNLNIAKRQRENNKNILLKGLTNSTDIDFNTAQNLFNLRLKIMKLQYLEQRKEELLKNNTYSSKIGIDNINKQIEAIEKDIAQKHNTDFENDFYKLEKNRKIIGFTPKLINNNGVEKEIQEAIREKDSDLIKRMDSILENEGISSEEDRKAEIRKYSVAYSNAASIFHNIDKVNSNLNKEMNELAKLEIQEVLFNTQRIVTKEDIRKQAEIFNATTDKAVRSAINNAFDKLTQIMNKYDTDEVLEYINSKETSVISDLSDSDKKDISDALLILTNNVATKESFITDLSYLASRIKYEKENKAKSIVNGVPTNEEIVEEPVKTAEDSDNETVDSSTGVTQKPQQSNLSQQQDNNENKVETPKINKDSSISSKSNKKKLNEEDLNNFYRRKLYFGVDWTRDKIIKMTEDFIKDNKIDVNSEIYNSIIEDMNAELENYKEENEETKNDSFESSIESLNKLIELDSDIASINNPDTFNINVNKLYTDVLRTFIDKYIKNSGIEAVNNKYIIRYEDIFRYINETVNDPSISSKLYENIVDAINNNINNISDDLIVLDKNDGTEVLDNAKKSLEVRYKEIFGDYEAQRVDIESVEHDSKFKQAFDQLQIGDKLDIAYLDNELQFYYNGTVVGRMPIPIQGTQNGFISYSMNNKGWNYKVWNNGNTVTSNLQSTFRKFLGSPNSNLVSYYLAQIITTNPNNKQKEILVNNIIKQPEFADAINKGLCYLGDYNHNEKLVDHLVTLYKYVSYGAGSTIKARRDALNAWFDNLYHSYKNVIEVNNNPDNKLAKVYSISDGSFIRRINETTDSQGNIIRDSNDYGLPSERIGDLNTAKIGFTYFGESGKVKLSDGTIQKFSAAHGGNTFVGIQNRNGRYSFTRAVNRKVKDAKEPENVKLIQAIKDQFKELISNRYNNNIYGSLEEDENYYPQIVEFLNSVFSRAKEYSGLFTKVVLRESDDVIYLNSGEQGNVTSIGIFKHNQNNTHRGGIRIRTKTGQISDKALNATRSDIKQELINLGKTENDELTREERDNLTKKLRETQLNEICSIFNELLDNAEFNISKNLLDADINNNHQSNGIIEKLQNGNIRFRVGNYTSKEFESYSDLILQNNLVLVDTDVNKEGKNFETRADADLIKQRLVIQFGSIVEEVDNNETPVEKSTIDNTVIDDDILEILNADYINNKGNALADIIFEKQLPGVFNESQLNILKKLELLPKNIIFAPERNKRASYFATDETDEQGNKKENGYKAGDIVLGKGFIDALYGNKNKKLEANVSDAIKMLVHENLHKKFHEELTNEERDKIYKIAKDIIAEFKNSLSNKEILKNLNWYKNNDKTDEDKRLSILTDHLNKFLYEDQKEWTDERKYEEFIVESLTDDVLLDYLNNVELKNDNNEKESLLRKLFRIFEYIFGIKINNNSALHKELVELSKYFNLKDTNTLFNKEEKEQEIIKEEPKKPIIKQGKRNRPQFGMATYRSALDDNYESSIPSLNNMNISVYSKLANPQNNTEIDKLLSSGSINFSCM